MTVHPFRFGACEVRPVTRELIRDGKPADIQPRAFDLLVYLIENPGRVVGKDELLDQVWGQRVVSESVVARTVMKARKAIGDDAGGPHFILTHHGQGYRFVGELVETAALPEGSVTIALSSSGSERVDAVPGMVAGRASRATDRPFAWEWLRSHRIPGPWLAVAGVAVLAIGAAFLAPEQVAPEAPSRAAVLPVINATERDALEWARLGLMGVLSGSLHRAGEVELVSTDELTSAMNAVGVGDVETVLVDEDRIALARQLEAGVMVQGQLRQTGDEFRLDINVFGHNGDEVKTTLSGSDPVDLAVRAGTRIAELQAIRGHDASALEPTVRSTYINETYARAMDAVARKHFDEAARLLEVVVDADNEQLQSKLDLAGALLQTRQTKRALTIATEVDAAALSGGDKRMRVASLLVRSQALFELDNLVDSESSARQALALASDYPGIEPDANLQLGILIYRQFRQEEARPLLQAAISGYRRLGSDYRLAGAHLQLGEAMRWLDMPAAILHYSRALELALRSGRRLVQVTALTRLADTNRAAGRCSQAMDQLDQALLLARQFDSPKALAQVYLARGRCERQLGGMEAAAGSTRKAIELAESAGELELLAATLFDYAGALGQRMGVDAVGSERLRRVAESLERHGQLGPAVGALLNFVQQLTRQADRYEELESLQWRVEFLSRSVDDPATAAGAIVLRAMLAYRQGNFRDAVSALEQARAVAGESTRVWVDSGAALLWLHLELGQRKEAEAVAASMATIMTGYPTLCIARARLLYEKKQFGAALKGQEACLAEFGSSMKDVDRAYRDSYAAAAISGKRTHLPDVTPSILWL